MQDLLIYVSKGLSAVVLPEVTDVLQAALDKGHADAHSLQQVMRRALGRFVGRRLRRRPMIVPVVIEA